MLIRLKKYIASASKYLVFEQNTATTRTAFLNIVNSFLTTVQQNSGLSAFRVIMDESNNTPDRIDRNELWVDVALQPVKTAEFIMVPIRIVATGTEI